MTTKNTTGSVVKTTGRVAAGTVKGTARVTSYTTTHWRGLLPFLCLAAALVFAGLSHVFAALYGHGLWAWAWIAAGGAVLWFWADGLVGQLDKKSQPPASAFLIYTALVALAAILAPAFVETYMGSALACIVLGVWWWNGAAYERYKKVQRMESNMRTILLKLGLTQETRVTHTSINDKGDKEWRVHLGDKDRAAAVQREDVAHLMKTSTDRIIVRLVDSKDTRRLKIVHLAKGVGKTGSVKHPAATAAGRAEGTDWAPGVRTVEQGAPIGPMMAEPDNTSVFHVYKPGYGAFHNLICGTTGSGKSVTIASVLAHLAASNNAVAAGVDLVKGGETFLPFYEAGGMANLLYLSEEQATSDQALLAAAQKLLEELKWLRFEVARRTAQMASGKVLGPDGQRTRIWPATPENPVLAYFFEEYASTISAIEQLDGDLADDIDAALNDVARTGRSSGVSLNLVTQRPTHDELPTKLRGQLNQTIMHKIKSANDMGRLWDGFDVDPVRVLSAGMGLCYCDEPGGVDPALTKAFDLSKPKTCSDIAFAYREHQPVVAWCGVIDSTATDTANPALATGGAGQDGPGGDHNPAYDLIADAARDDDLSTEDVEDDGADMVEPEDDERLAAIMKVLESADGLVPRSHIDREVNVSVPTMKRLMRVLRDQGKVVAEGRGKATKYRINPGALASVGTGVQ